MWNTDIIILSSCIYGLLSQKKKARISTHHVLKRRLYLGYSYGSWKAYELYRNSAKQC